MQESNIEKDEQLEKSLELAMEEIEKAIYSFLKKSCCQDNQKIPVVTHILGNILAMNTVILADCLLKDKKASKERNVKNQEEALKFVFNDNVENIKHFIAKIQKENVK